MESLPVRDQRLADIWEPFNTMVKGGNEELIDEAHGLIYSPQFENEQLEEAFKLIIHEIMTFNPRPSLEAFVRIARFNVKRLKSLSTQLDLFNRQLRRLGNGKDGLVQRANDYFFKVTFYDENFRIDEIRQQNFDKEMIIHLSKYYTLKDFVEYCDQSFLAINHNPKGTRLVRRGGRKRKTRRKSRRR